MNLAGIFRSIFVKPLVLLVDKRITILGESVILWFFVGCSDEKRPQTTGFEQGYPEVYLPLRQWL
jgi:hypothetical protein